MSHRNGSGNLVSGSILIFLGVLFLLDNFDIISFGRFWSDFWPLVLVIIGISIISKSFKKKDYHRYEAAEDYSSVASESYATDSASFNNSNIFGEIRVASNSKEFIGGNIDNVFGEIFVDLSNIDFPDGMRELHISGVFGAIKIIPPKEIPVRLSASVVAGEIRFFGEKKGGVLIDINSSSNQYDSVEKKLFIKASIIFGEIRLG